MKRFVGWAFGMIALIVVATALGQPPAGRGGAGGGMVAGGPPPMPIIDVLDVDHDRVISENELKNATASLLKLDKNHDGKLTENEFGPQAGRPAGMGGQGGGGVGGRDVGKSRRTQLEGSGQGGRQRAGAPGKGEDRGISNSERMVEHAMEFDIDHDGKLSKTELKKFADNMQELHLHPRGAQIDAEAPENDSGGDQRPRRPE